MKMRSKWSITISLTIIAMSAWILTRSDVRLIGTYVPDVDASYPEWNREYGFSRDSVKGALDQLFNKKPMSFTKRHLLISSQRGDRSYRYVVLLKDKTSSLIAMYPPELFRIDFTVDGISIVQKRILWHPRHPLLPISMKKQEAPTTQL
jgi:hypothetical protein